MNISSIENDNVGLFLFGSGRKALFFQYSGKLFRLVDVHLTTVRVYVVFHSAPIDVHNYPIINIIMHFDENVQ